MAQVVECILCKCKALSSNSIPSHPAPPQIIEAREKDYFLMEEEFIRNQEQTKPLEEKQEEEISKVDDLRGPTISLGILEEITDDRPDIVSTSLGSEHYVSILSFMDKDLLEPSCSDLNHKVHAMIGVLTEDTDLKS
jgi:26S proteasome regulatory subunit T2